MSPPSNRVPLRPADNTADRSYAHLHESRDSFRAKLAQEKLIESSSIPYSIPYSIIRATQFFELIGRIAEEAPKATRSVRHLPSSSRWLQTMSPMRSLRSR